MHSWWQPPAQHCKAHFRALPRLQSACTDPHCSDNGDDDGGDGDGDDDGGDGDGDDDEDDDHYHYHH